MKKTQRMATIATVFTHSGKPLTVRARKDRSSRRIFLMLGNDKYMIRLDQTEKLINGLCDLMETIERRKGPRA